MHVVVVVVVFSFFEAKTAARDIYIYTTKMLRRTLTSLWHVKIFKFLPPLRRIGHYGVNRITVEKLFSSSSPFDPSQSRRLC